MSDVKKDAEDAAGRRWSVDTVEHRAMRAAFVEGVMYVGTLKVVASGENVGHCTTITQFGMTESEFESWLSTRPREQ
ncbi:hypothetical protein [Bradyrhizobium sp. HKCCYLS20291]|uniref:hypothetical protein n=1 Tax=Bradyrhizobium sp. HKCCYLS20291 TaxID=3420766 RepID=UPI003EBA5C39